MKLLDTAEFVWLNKPSGVPTVPAGNVLRNETFWHQAELECGRKLWVVHRLDKETSGVLLFAKNAEAHRDACSWFENREVKKHYWFLAEGTPTLPVFRADDPIDGKRSRTQFRVLRRFGDRDLGADPYFAGEAIPVTGRKHQIRIHLSKAGLPILGDVLYGGKRKIRRHSGEMHAPHFFLHARSLAVPGFPPVEAPLPEDWENLWEGEPSRENA